MSIRAKLGDGWRGRSKRTAREPRKPQPNLSTEEEGKHMFGNAELFDELNDVVSTFTQRHRDLVMSTGFGSFAEGVHSVRFDSQFCVWLMGKVDSFSNSIRLSGNTRLRIFPEDVSKVFGIPCGGRQVWDSSLDKSRSTHDRIRRMVGCVDADEPASLAAYRTLKNMKQLASREDEVAFKVAFIIYVVSILVDTKAPEDDENTNYYPALAQIETVHLFNWSFYVLEEFTLACWQAISDSRNCRPTRPSLGAVLFLQIFYLDNMDYGNDRAPAGLLPRMKAFNKDCIGRLIMADTIGLEGSPPSRVFGKGKLRDLKEVVYRRTDKISSQGDEVAFTTPSPTTQKRSRTVPVQLGARQDEQSHESSIDEKQVATRGIDTIIAVKAFKARCLKHLINAKALIDQEADLLVDQLHQRPCDSPANDTPTQQTPVCPPPNDKSQHTPNDKSQHIRTGARAAKKTSPVSRPLQECNRPMNSPWDFEVPSFDLLAHDGQENTPPPMTPGSASPPKKIPKHSQPRSPLSEAKLSSDSFLWAKCAIDEINLNAAGDDEEFTHSPIRKIPFRQTTFARPPWSSNDGPPRRDAAESMDFYRWAVSSNIPATSVWVRHAVPKFIEIGAASLVAQLRSGGHIEPDTCDLLLRVFHQVDCDLEKEKKSFPWRHFIETDFAMRALAEEDYTAAKSVRRQFTGDHVRTQLSTCFLYLTMVQIEKKWAAIAWDFKRKQITVFAPGHHPHFGSGKWSGHEKVVSVLHKALGNCLNTFFDGWAYPWVDWPKVFIDSKNKGPSAVSGMSWPESGVLALQFCRTFDGVTYNESVKTHTGVPYDRPELLYDILHIKQNKGSLPPQFVQEICV
ncbi:hypothetical protein ACP70R_049956 [Stipagrostis hirtigluma subsp. patula]